MQYDFSEEEKIVLFALGALDNTPLTSKIKLQKLLFLITNVFKDYRDILEFEPHLFGPYSETVDYVLEDLTKLGFVESKGSRNKLTEKGLGIFKKFKPKKELLSVIEDFKEFLNDVTDEELLTFIYVLYPNYIGEAVLWNNLRKNRVDYAISLLKKNKISLEKAITVSGLSTQEFETILKERKIRW